MAGFNAGEAMAFQGGENGPVLAAHLISDDMLTPGAELLP